VPSPRTRRSLALAAVAVLAALGLAGCSASQFGYLAVGLDPAGRMLASVALCDELRLKSITLTDETNGTVATVKPATTPAFGGTIILSGPIVNAHPEGPLDLFDLSHTYSLAAVAKKADSDDDAGSPASLRFTLDDLVKDPTLRQDRVLAGGAQANTFVAATRTSFLRAAQIGCS
jgi:hypothetical protein